MTSSNITIIQTKISGESVEVPEFSVFPNHYLLKPVFRIPSIVLTQKNTLLVSCENRAIIDDKGEIDILIARKEVGKTFFEIRKVFSYVADKGRVMNPIFLVDKDKIYCFAGRLKDNNKYADEHYSDEVDFVYKYSEDDGKTWSEEYSLKNLWNTDVVGIIPSSVNGIITKQGEYLIPTMVIKDGQWRSGLLICSKGKWRFSCCTPNVGDNECTVYELNDSIILDCRTLDKIRRRYVYDIENDIFSEINPNNIPCELNISTLIIKNEKDNVFYMTYPNSNNGVRENICFYKSRDAIKWEFLYSVFPGYAGFGYSCIALNNKYMYVCFETTSGIFCQDLTNMKDIIHNF